MLFKQKKALVISDFDGTICTVDMGNKVLSHFTKKVGMTLIVSMSKAVSVHARHTARLLR